MSQKQVPFHLRVRAGKVSSKVLAKVKQGSLKPPPRKAKRVKQVKL